MKELDHVVTQASVPKYSISACPVHTVTDTAFQPANCWNQSMKTINDYKSVLAAIGFILLITSLAACDRGADSDMNAGKAGASPGYNAGYDFGIKLAQLRQQQPGIELDDAFKGMLDALSDTNQLISRTEICAKLQPAELKPAKA